jgi:glutamine---fructose-6-phosphate transaminase (isomerizing)
MSSHEHPNQLRHQISIQGDAIRQLIASDLSAQSEQIAAAKRILLVGTGTSFHAAQLGALMFQSAGIDAQAVASVMMAQAPPPARDGDLVVVISHTGETAYALAVRRALIDSGRRFISVAGPRAGWEEAIVTPVVETSETYTVSYTGALTVLALLAASAGAPGLGSAALAQTADRVDAIVADPSAQNPLTPPARAMVIVGPGVWSISAREGALKTREAAHLLCEGYDSENLLHGHAVPYGAGDTLVALQPGDDPDGLTAKLMNAAATAGMDVVEFTEDVIPGSVLLAQIPMTVRLQTVAASLAEQRGEDPDHAITGGWGETELWVAGAPE